MWYLIAGSLGACAGVVIVGLLFGNDEATVRRKRLYEGRREG